MFWPTEKIVFIHSHLVENRRPSTLNSASDESLLSEYLRGAKRSVNPEFALYWCKISALWLIRSSSPHPTSARARFPIVKATFVWHCQIKEIVHLSLKHIQRTDLLGLGDKEPSFGTGLLLGRLINRPMFCKAKNQKPSKRYSNSLKAQKLKMSQKKTHVLHG